MAEGDEVLRYAQDDNRSNIHRLTRPLMSRPEARGPRCANARGRDHGGVVAVSAAASRAGATEPGWPLVLGQEASRSMRSRSSRASKGSSPRQVRDVGIAFDEVTAIELAAAIDVGRHAGADQKAAVVVVVQHATLQTRLARVASAAAGTLTVGGTMLPSPITKPANRPPRPDRPSRRTARPAGRVH